MTNHPNTAIVGIHGKSPRVYDGAVMAPGCRIIGNVEIGPDDLLADETFLAPGKRIFSRQLWSN